MTKRDEFTDREESTDRADSGNREDADDQMGYRCPRCDEVVHMISVRGPDESYAIPCGCLIPPRSFA